MVTRPIFFWLWRRIAVDLLLCDGRSTLIQLDHRKKSGRVVHIIHKRQVLFGLIIFTKISGRDYKYIMFKMQITLRSSKDTYDYACNPIISYVPTYIYYITRRLIPLLCLCIQNVYRYSILSIPCK